jgi:hypothetical protein
VEVHAIMRIHLIAAVSLLAVAWAPAPGAAEVAVGVTVAPPIIVGPPPPLVVVRPVPAVRYAPSLGIDVFVYGGAWYYPYRGHWFVGRSHAGPWRPIPIAVVPRPVLAVPAKFYKAPPGHQSHRWRGHGGPPGHARGRHQGHR